MVAKFLTLPEQPHGHTHGQGLAEDAKPYWMTANSPVCAMCHKVVFEVRPFGPNHESICAECAAIDPAMTEQRWRDMNPNG